MPAIPSHIRAVFFDVVGTVLLPHPPAPSIYAEVARRGGLNLAASEIRKKFIEAYNAQESIDRTSGWITSEEREIARWRSIVATALTGISDSESCFQQLYRHFGNSTAWQLNADIGKVIAALVERGIAVGLGSNYDCRLWTVIDGFPELAALKERTVISSVVGYRKPAVEFFTTVTRLAGCQAHEVLFVGDDLENDYLGALEAGLDARLFDETNRSNVTKRIVRLMDLIQSK